MGSNNDSCMDENPSSLGRETTLKTDILLSFMKSGRLRWIWEEGPFELILFPSFSIHTIHIPNNAGSQNIILTNAELYPKIN